MFDKFFNLDTEKQDRILNAAIKEFARKGYDHASTNEIVKEAGISKGLLFHYFQNKKQLYLFLFEYCYTIVAEDFYKKMDLTEQDFFDRMRLAVMLKVELQMKYPDIFRFLEGSVFEDSAEIKEELEKRINTHTESDIGKVYQGVDVSRFRDDMDLEKIFTIITATFEKLSEETILRAKLSPAREIDYQKVQQVAEGYFEVLKKAFYK